MHLPDQLALVDAVVAAVGDGDRSETAQALDALLPHTSIEGTEADWAKAPIEILALLIQAQWIQSDRQSSAIDHDTIAEHASCLYAVATGQQGHPPAVFSQLLRFLTGEPEVNAGVDRVLGLEADTPTWGPAIVALASLLVGLTTAAAPNPSPDDPNGSINKA